jgi:Flp pilus assembly protein TadG
VGHRVEDLHSEGAPDRSTGIGEFEAIPIRRDLVLRVAAAAISELSGESVVVSLTPIETSAEIPAEEGERGAAVVEMAFVLLPFLLILFGMIDLGLGINAHLMVTSGSREAARLGTLGATAAEIEAEARAMTPRLEQSQLLVTITCEQFDDTPCVGTFPAGDLRNAVAGDSVVVALDYIHDLITPAPKLIGMGNTFRVSSTTEMRVE